MCVETAKIPNLLTLIGPHLKLSHSNPRIRRFYMNILCYMFGKMKAMLSWEDGGNDG